MVPSKRIQILLFVTLALLFAGCSGSGGGGADTGNVDLKVSHVSSQNTGGLESLQINISTATFTTSNGTEEIVQVDRGIKIIGSERDQKVSINLAEGSYSSVEISIEAERAVSNGRSVELQIPGSTLSIEKDFEISDGNTVNIAVDSVKIENTDKWTILPVPEQTGVEK